MNTEDTVVKIPKTAKEACKSKNIKWACETTKILDAQKIGWSLYYGDKNEFIIDAFNYGDGVHYDPSINKQSSCIGKIFTQELRGDKVFTDVILQKGNIKYMSHRQGLDLIDGELGDVILKINSFIYLNFNKYTGYLRFQNIGKYVISISLHIDQEIIDLYDSEWKSKLIDLYSGKSWK